MTNAVSNEGLKSGDSQTPNKIVGRVNEAFKNRTSVLIESIIDVNNSSVTANAIKINEIISKFKDASLIASEY